MLTATIRTVQAPSPVLATTEEAVNAAALAPSVATSMAGAAAHAHPPLMRSSDRTDSASPQPGDEIVTEDCSEEVKREGDETVSALDRSTQSQITDLLMDLRRLNLEMVVIGHDHWIVRRGPVGRHLERAVDVARMPEPMES